MAIDVGDAGESAKGGLWGGSCLRCSAFFYAGPQATSRCRFKLLCHEDGLSSAAASIVRSLSYMKSNSQFSLLGWTLRSSGDQHPSVATKYHTVISTTTLAVLVEKNLKRDVGTLIWTRRERRRDGSIRTIDSAFSRPANWRVSRPLALVDDASCASYQSCLEYTTLSIMEIGGRVVRAICMLVSIWYFDFYRMRPSGARMRTAFDTICRHNR